MDSLIFELQIVFYFQLFLSANVRDTMMKVKVVMGNERENGPRGHLLRPN